MSNNDFNRRARVEISIDIRGSGTVNPFSSGEVLGGTWTMEGSIVALEPDINLTIREETCGTSFYKQRRSFQLPGSTGNTSGTIDVGQVQPSQPPQFTVFPFGTSLIIGEWTVNTSPVLERDGKIDGDPATGAYLVALPANADPDDAILVNPPIDDLTRVYPGDAVFVSGGRWRINPQHRYPKSDRTFFWDPNTSPEIKSGGLVDGVIAKPGTIMIPTADYYASGGDDPAIDGMQYFFAGIGIMFNGQQWTRDYFEPVVYVPEDGPPEAKTSANPYGSPYSRNYQKRFEGEQSEKPFLNCNIPVDDSKQVKVTFTFDEGGSSEYFLQFRWSRYNNNIVPYGIIHDFGDPWSAYWLNLANWQKQRGFARYSFLLESPFNDPPLEIDNLYVDSVQGGVTEITQNFEINGETYTNSYTITLNVTTQLA